jgi:putative sigma-54 modulation protein
MQIHISPRHLRLTGAIHAYVAEKISCLEHLTGEIMGAHVVLWHDETRSPAKCFRVKVHLAVPGPDIHGEDSESDLYAAIDKVSDKLARQLRKRKTRLKSHKLHVQRKSREKVKRTGRAIA